MKKLNVQILLLVLVMKITIINAQQVNDFVSLNAPDDIEIDHHGNIWVNYSDILGNDKYHLARIDRNGTKEDIITDSKVLGQFGVNDSIIWICGPWGANEFVFKYNFLGQKLDSISMPYATSIILEEDGTWYVAQNAIGRITKVNPNKSKEVLFTGQPLNYSLALAKDENGIFYTCNLFDAKVIKVDIVNNMATVLSTLPVKSNYSLGFLAYHSGKLYVPTFSQTICVLDTIPGNYSIYAGKNNTIGDMTGSLTNSRFYNPTAVDITTSGDTMYVTDAGNNKIKMITGILATSIRKEITIPDYTIFFDSSKNSLSIKLQDQSKMIEKIEIFNLKGQILEEKTILNGNSFAIFDLKSRLKGHYPILIKCKDGTSFKGKLIIN